MVSSPSLVTMFIALKQNRFDMASMLILHMSSYGYGSLV